MRRGTNLPAMGTFNRAVVLDLIRQGGQGITRIELAEQSGLSAQTVTNLCRSLQEQGLIREAGTQSGERGKPRTLFTLVPTGAFAIGVHLDPAVITGVILDLAGTVVARAERAFSAAAGPGSGTEIIAAIVDELIEGGGIERASVLGIGVASPGPIDDRRGLVLHPPLLHGWDRVPLREDIARRSGLPVLLDKDVTAAAAAELWMTPADEAIEGAIFLYFGTGIGSGVILDHRLYRGQSGNVGDVGHLRVAGAAGDGPLSGLGELSSARRVVTEAAAAGVIPAVALDADYRALRAAMRAVMTAADAGDPAAARIIGELSTHLASGIVALANFLDVDTAIIGGPLWDPEGDAVTAATGRRVNADPALILDRPVTVRGSRVGTDVAAVGAACLVLDETLSPSPASLLIAQ